MLRATGGEGDAGGDTLGKSEKDQVGSTAQYVSHVCEDLWLRQPSLRV